MPDEAEEDFETLEAAAEMFDQLLAGTFYDRQAAAEQWLQEQSGDDITRRIVEGHFNGCTLELAPRRTRSALQSPTYQGGTYGIQRSCEARCQRTH